MSRQNSLQKQAIIATTQIVKSNHDTCALGATFGVVEVEAAAEVALWTPEVAPLLALLAAVAPLAAVVDPLLAPLLACAATIVIGMSPKAGVQTIVAWVGVASAPSLLYSVSVPLGGSLSSA